MEAESPNMHLSVFYQCHISIDFTLLLDLGVDLLSAQESYQ